MLNDVLHTLASPTGGQKGCASIAVDFLDSLDIFIPTIYTKI
jgi:hypothetical protein